MRTVSRGYQPGDEAQINRLYLSLTGRDRTPGHFAWEWLETWAGQGSMNLVFDLDRAEGDQLVAQYSLIPTPFSVWGRPYLAGKTENCMSHPDCRGTGLYFAHERECFEKEKDRYSFFFTTAGTVTGGAVGRIRGKLGYLAFDDWANFTLWLQADALRRDIGSVLAKQLGRTKRLGRAERLAPALGALAAGALQAYSLARRPRTCRFPVTVYGPREAPLAAIEALWERNRQRYGVTVERRADYLRWRVDDDPHVRHEYLTLHDGERLVAFAVTFVQDDDLHVVDLLVDGARADLFADLFAALVRRGRRLRLARVKCLTLQRSALLPRMLVRAGFIDSSVFTRGGLLRRRAPQQFYLYIPEELRGEPTVTGNADWYMTSLVLEGLPRSN